MMKKPGKVTRKQYRTQVKEEFPESMDFGQKKFRKKLSMRYGENPGYPAGFYAEDGAKGPNMATMEVIKEGTKGLSYINVADMDLGQRLVRKLSRIYKDQSICVLVKHEVPSGVARGENPVNVFENAWRSDPLSNFGSVDVFNFKIEEELAQRIVEKGRNVEVVYAPDISSQALEIFSSRRSLRAVKMGSYCQEPSQDNGLEFKRVTGGLLVQQRFDSKITSSDSVDVVSQRKATPDELEAAVFNWNVVCFTRSNAIVIGSKEKIHGVGSGQRSRIDATEDAIRFSKRGHGAQGCVMASDAFMPFPDVVELAAKEGITAIIYPLGSIRDQEVIERANDSNLAMIATKRSGETDSERSFLHR